MKYLIAIATLFVSTSAFAFEPEVSEKLDILTKIVKSSVTTAEINADINALIGPNPAVQIQVIQFDCLNLNSFEHDWNFSCDVNYVRGTNSGSELYTLFVDGHAIKGQRVIDSVGRRFVPGN